MLDRSQPMGHIYGADNGAVYYQKGKHFDAEGYEVDFASGKRIESKAEAAPAKEKKQKAAKVKEPKAEDVDAAEPDKGAGDVVAKNGVNLSAWARGEAAGVSIAKVKNAVEEVFGRMPKNGDEALKIIRGEELE